MPSVSRAERESESQVSVIMSHARHPIASNQMLAFCVAQLALACICRGGNHLCGFMRGVAWRLASNNACAQRPSLRGERAPAYQCLAPASASDNHHNAIENIVSIMKLIFVTKFAISPAGRLLASINGRPCDDIRAVAAMHEAARQIKPDQSAAAAPL